MCIVAFGFDAFLKNKYGELPIAVIVDPELRYIERGKSVNLGAALVVNAYAKDGGSNNKLSEAQTRCNI